MNQLVPFTPDRPLSSSRPPLNSVTPRVGAPCMRIADVGGEEFEEADARTLAAGVMR
jgi:hypothetical protein